MTEVGVVVGRFQTPALSEGHRRLLDRALEHGTLVVVLGCPRTYATTRNPLDYDTRRSMILRAYPEATVVGVTDENHDEVWSRKLDALLSTTMPSRKFRLYGSRDSFITHYSGKWPTQEVISAGNISATEARFGVSGVPGTTEDFRTGAIYAAMRRPPMAYQAVDVACVDRRRRKVLMVSRKTENGLLRFPGGFREPTDESLEYAAARELTEETGVSAGGAPAMAYVPRSSLVVNDWRYRDVSDVITTALFVTDYEYGHAEAADDVDGVHWVAWSGLPKRVVDAHKPLAEMLVAYIKERRKK